MESSETEGRHGASHGHRWQYLSRYQTGKAALVAGFLAAGLAVLVAHSSPASGYEVSIYWGTPALFWGLVLLALVVAVVVSVYWLGTLLGRLGLLLAGTSVVTVLALPLLRGYHYYGLTDGMNHLGYARKLATGVREYLGMLYPGGHSTAILFDAVAGVGIPRALVLVALVCALAFVLFVPLAVRELVPRPGVVALAVFAGLLVMPVNNVATSNRFHPFTLATLLAPIGFYLLFKHVRHGAEDDWLPGWLSAASLVLPLVGVGLVLYHPQAMFNVVVIVGTVAGLQLLARLRGSAGPIARSRHLYGQAVFFLAVFYLWSSNHWQASATFERTQAAIMGYLEGSAGVAPNVQSRAQSAESIDVNFLELFLKLFSVELLAGLAVAGLVVWNLSGRIRLREEADSAVTYLTLGGVVLLPYFLTQLIGDIAHNFFRHFGFVMMLVTLLLPIAVYRLWARFEPHRFVRPAVVVVVVGALVLSLVAVFPSPYIYLYNHQASDQHMTGIEETFEHLPENEPQPPLMSSTGVVLTRYKNAMAAKPGTSWYPGIVRPFPRPSFSVPPPSLHTLREYYADHPEEAVRRDHYLLVTAVDRKRELVAYDGLRYSEADYRAVGTQRMVHRVHANGQFEGYYVDLPPPAGEIYEGGAGNLTRVPGPG